MTLQEGHQEIDPRVLLGQWCRLFFAALREGGVTDVVLSPGSRNTPLIWGAVSDSGLRTHSVIDERSAGFFGLGLARASGRPVALVCTSGSAGAHYYPSLIEAHHAGVPLVVVTADRPSHLQNCGAPQTIRQEGLYGHFAPSTMLEEPSTHASSLGALLRMTRQAAARCQGPAPGPVHLNFPLCKPLEPRSPKTAAERSFADFCTRLVESTEALLPGRNCPSKDALEAFAEKAQLGSPQTLVTLGPVSHAIASSARRMAERFGAVCLSELPQAGRAFPLAHLAGAISAGRVPSPKRIVHIGPPCVSSAWGTYLQTTASELYVLPGDHHLEPTGRARIVLTGDLNEILERLEIAAPDTAAAPDAVTDSTAAPLATTELGVWASFHREALIQTLESSADTGTISEVHAAWQVLVHSGGARQVLLGNSLPLRLAGWISPALPACLAHFTCARGVNGIDGWISAAAGAAEATGAPTVALLGDVTAAHDLSGLALARRARMPLVIVVLDNGGGHIFDHLPARDRLDQETYSYLTTPPLLDFRAACATYAVEHREVRQLDGVEAALQGALDRRGATLIRIVVDPSATVAFLDRLSGATGAQR